MAQSKTKTEAKEEKMEEKAKTESKKEVRTTGKCNDPRCPVHGTISVRGRRFKGHVIKIGNKNITIELEKLVFLQKYERYAKSRIRLHAHLPECFASQVKIGSNVEIGECRPLSKTKHHVIIGVDK